MSPSIRVTLRWEEAEALLNQASAEPTLRLRARAKLIGPLLANPSYEPPWRRELGTAQRAHTARRRGSA